MAEKEYIELEAALRANCYFCSAHLKDDSPCDEKCADYMKFMEIPAADVRPVVLCRDCKWWRGEGTICKGIGIDFDADGFCCEGERKDGADMREES